MHHQAEGSPVCRMAGPQPGSLILFEARADDLKQLLIGELPLSSLEQLNANRLGSGVRGANNVNAARYPVHSSSLGLVCIGSQSGKGLDAGPCCSIRVCDVPQPIGQVLSGAHARGLAQLALGPPNWSRPRVKSLTQAIR